MDAIFNLLKQSLDDNYLSKSERNMLHDVLGDQMLDPRSLNTLRAKVFELAIEKVNETNYRLVMEWVKHTNQLLVAKSIEKSKVYFSPGDACRHAIIRQMNAAIHQLSICVFTISDDAISKAILDTHQRGVGVRIITDNDKSLDIGSDIEHLAGQGIPVKIDNTSNHMHHKFMVVDDQSVITGSYNWTSSAARFNHENIVLMQEQRVVTNFQDEFENLWQAMSAY
ncbi:MAG: DUF1669 domain-containing protein [Cyclobacteriaceae bacterium]|nr:DUF1669 domain-containing protein [Cyclobacteriaceae bacterium]